MLVASIPNSDVEESVAGFPLSPAEGAALDALEADLGGSPAAAAAASLGSDSRFNALLMASASSPWVYCPKPDWRKRITPSLSSTIYVGKDSTLKACKTSSDRSMYSDQSMCCA